MKMPELKSNSEIVTKFIEYLELQGKSEKTVENKVWGLVPFLQFINEGDINKVTQSDIEKFAISLRKGDKKPGTQYMYLNSLKFFFEWLQPGNSLFKNIKMKRPKTDNSKKKFVNLDDVRKMLSVCKTQRDRAFLFLMWDSAGRLEEILNLNIDNVVPEKHGVRVHLDGKTGQRDVLVIDAVPDLQNWLNLNRGKKGSPLFPTPAGGRMSHSGAQSLVDRIAIRAGITDKKIHPHSFRHGRLTELSNLGMSEMQLRLFAGWSNDSEMPATYIHTQQKDVTDKLLKLKGIRSEEEETIQDNMIAPIGCVRCGALNPYDARYCSSCSQVLDPALAREIEEADTNKRNELQEMRAEIEKLKKSMVEKTVQEENFRQMVDETLLHMVGPSTPTTDEYRTHTARRRTDPVYRLRYDRFEEAYLNEKQDNSQQLKELSDQDTANTQKTIRTFDSLLDKL